MNNNPANGIIAVAAISDALFLVVGTYLHPMSADLNAPVAAFTEYAADRHWIANHLMQLVGVMLMLGASVLLGRRLATGPAQTVAALATAGAVASMAVAGVLQAVDGIALKAMADAWAMAPEQEKAALFSAAFAVRQIEIGLASMTCLFLGITVSLFGMALLIDCGFPKWLGI